MENNKVTLIGKVSNIQHAFTIRAGVEYYTLYISSRRNSGIEDTIPVIVREKDLHGINELVSVTGCYRSRNETVEGKHKLILNVYAECIEAVNSTEHVNKIELTGYIVKSPVFRETPKHRLICDLIIAVNSGYRNSAYLPCIVWGENAKAIKDSPVGTKIKLTGRIQSRQYTKVIDGNSEERVAYEVSVNNITKEN